MIARTCGRVLFAAVVFLTSARRRTLVNYESQWREQIAPAEPAVAAAARARIDDLTKPRGSLGRVEDLAVRLCTIAGGTPAHKGYSDLLRELMLKQATQALALYAHAAPAKRRPEDRLIAAQQRPAGARFDHLDSIEGRKVGREQHDGVCIRPRNRRRKLDDGAPAHLRHVAHRQYVKGRVRDHFKTEVAEVGDGAQVDVGRVRTADCQAPRADGGERALHRGPSRNAR